MVNRIPYADKEKVKKLPEEAKAILGMIKDKVKPNAYKEIENSFVGINEFSNEKLKENSSDTPNTKVGLSYGGQLDDFGQTIVQNIGVYSPNNIPYDILEKMSKDPTIALGLSVIEYTPAGLNWRIECDDEKQRLVYTKIIKNIYRDTIISLAKGVRYGCAIGQKVWDYKELNLKTKSKKGKSIKVNESFYVYDKIKFVHPKTIRMHLDKDQNIIGVSQNFLHKENVTVPQVKTKDLVIYSHNMEFGNYFGNARLNNAYPPWYWSMVITQFMLKYVERSGQPLMLLRAPAGTRTDHNGNKVDNITHALKIGQAAISNSIVVLPKEISKDGSHDLWDFKYVSDERRGDFFINLLNFFDTRKLRAIFVPDKLGLASDGSSHSASGASAGDTLDVFMMTEQALINDIECVFDEQIIKPIQIYNFPKNKIRDANLKIEKLDFNRKLLLKDLFLRLIMMSAGAIRDGNKPKTIPSLKKLSEMLDVPIEEFEEMFEKIPIPSPLGKVGVPPTAVKKKEAQDANNQNRGTQRKIRMPKERSVKEKRQ